MCELFVKLDSMTKPTTDREPLDHLGDFTTTARVLRSRRSPSPSAHLRRSSPQRSSN